MTQFWREAPPPWNELGPEIAAAAKRGISTTPRITVPPSQLMRWASQLRLARKRLGLSQAQTAAQAGLNSSEVTKIENDEAGKDARGWAKLAAFYGITLE